MNEDTFNLEMRKFLKRVGITSQREIEHAVEKGIASGQLTGRERLAIKVLVEIETLGLQHRLEDTIALE